LFFWQNFKAEQGLSKTRFKTSFKTQETGLYGFNLRKR
jgi:hypothetical protein